MLRGSICWLQESRVARSSGTIEKDALWAPGLDWDLAFLVNAFSGPGLVKVRGSFGNQALRLRMETLLAF